MINAFVLLTFYVATSESPVAARLRGLTVPPAVAAARARRDAVAQRPGFLATLLGTLGQFAFRRNEKSLAHLLETAGLRGPSAMPIFLGARTLVSLGPALLILVPQMSSGEPLGGTLWKVVGAWGVGHFGANYWLRQKSLARIRMITESLPDTLDLLVVCLEAGLGMNQAIARVGQERAEMKDPLGTELRQVTAELKGGRPRDESLHDLGVRNGVEDLKSLTAMIIQSQKLGASLGQTLRAHADLLRTKRRQRAEEAARKLPIKILIPLACFLLPPLFIVIIGPAFLSFGDVVTAVSGR
jgi:tight adherence protein C